jgi:L-fucose isomerase
MAANVAFRESLEEQTMNMAKAAAQLIEENLRFPGGEKVECVIADTTIGGVADAARCADKFEQEGVGVSLTVTPCWCYGTEVMDANPLIPKAVWGFNGTERPGQFTWPPPGRYTQKGLPTFVSMAVMYRMQLISQSRPMFRKKSCVLSKPAWPLPR